MPVNLRPLIDDYYNHGSSEAEILATIDFADWNFFPEQLTEFKNALLKAVRSEMAEAFRNTLQSDPPDIEFDGDQGVVACLNVGSNCNDGKIYFGASLLEMIDDFIDRADHWTDDETKEAKAKLAKCLRDCADKLESD